MELNFSGTKRFLHSGRKVPRIILLGYVLDRERIIIMRYETNSERNHREYYFNGESIRFHAERKSRILLEQIAAAAFNFNGFQLLPSYQRL